MILKGQQKKKSLNSHHGAHQDFTNFMKCLHQKALCSQYMVQTKAKEIHVLIILCPQLSSHPWGKLLVPHPHTLDPTISV